MKIHLAPYFRRDLPVNVTRNFASYLSFMYFHGRKILGEVQYGKYPLSDLGSNFSLSKYNYASWDRANADMFWSNLKINNRYINHPDSMLEFGGYDKYIYEMKDILLHYPGVVYPLGHYLDFYKKSKSMLTLQSIENYFSNFYSEKDIKYLTPKLMAVTEAMLQADIPAPTLRDLSAEWKKPENREDLLQRLEAVGFKGKLPF